MVMDVNMERRRDKQGPKFRPAPSPKQLHQEQAKLTVPHTQSHRGSKESVKVGRGTQDSQSHAVLPAPVFHRQFESSIAGGLVGRQSPAYSRDLRATDAAPGVKFGDNLSSKKERGVSPSGELPPPIHTTKSSSLSRDLSPSRITAQVQSAMSESSQPLLLSALQGKMPVPMMMAMSPKSETHTDANPPGARGAEASPHGAAYSVEMRNSPVQVDSLGQVRPEKVPQMVPTKPFEHLLGALAAAKDSADSRGQPALLYPVHHLPTTPNRKSSHQQGESKRRSPSPKPVSASRSPHHVPQQGQRHSPVAMHARASPSAVKQEAMGSVPLGAHTGMQVPNPHRLVQQHLLAATIPPAHSFMTTSVSAAVSTQTVRVPISVASTHAKQVAASARGGMMTVPASAQEGLIPSAPSPHSLPQSSVRLSTIPLTTAIPASNQRGAQSAVRQSVTSVGTGTEAKQYASQGAQTKQVSSLTDNVRDMQLVSSSVHHTFQQHSGGSVTQLREVGGINPSVSPPRFSSREPSPHSQAEMRVHPIPVCLAGVGGTVVPPAAHMHGGVAAGGRPSQHLSQAVDLTMLHTGVMTDRKGQSLSPTPAHSNKPIPVLSHAQSQAHVHISHPRPSHATSASTSVSVGQVNHVSVHQPVVSLCRMTVSTEPVPHQTVRPKAETKPLSVVSCAQYQPKHHYNQNSQPAQTITSQTVEAGPVVKDFIPVAGSPEPPHFLQPPPLPPHVNPFTFPTTGIKIHFSGDGPSYSFSSMKKDVTSGHSEQRVTYSTSIESDATLLRQRYLGRDSNQTDGDDMPRLTPEATTTQTTTTTCATAFNHVDGKEQLVNPFNMRLQNLQNFPVINTTYRSAYRSHSVAVQRAKAGSITSAAKSLDLLRQNIQKSINKELDQVVQKYVEKFFQPAAANIRLNNGANSVSEEHINAVCRQIFEEAKRMYTPEVRRSVTPVGEIPDNISETGSINGTGRRVSPNPLKRSKVSDSDSEKGSDGGFPKKVVKRKGRPPLHASGRSTPLKPIKSGDQVRREGPKWDPERIKQDTLFIMGARANKALGLGNTRGRLYIRHPDVFKYSGDQDDKVWLHEQKLMPATGGKAYMLIVEDIVDLSKTDEYKDSPTLMMHECRGFTVPEWMLVKIKEQMQAMRSDNKRSRSRSPVAGRPEPPKTLPFSAFSDTASNNDIDSIGNKNSLQPSPTDTEEMEFLSTVDNDDTQPADASPFGVTGGFDDAGSPSSSQLDAVEETSVPTPFS